MPDLEQDVFELRQQVAKLERQLAFVLKHFDLAYREEPNTGVSPEILDLIRTGDRLGAIKCYREATGASLKQAKEYIDSLAV